MKKFHNALTRLARPSRCAFAAMLCFVLLVSLLPGPARAAESMDVTHPVSLTVSFRRDSVAMEGAEFRIYLVATMDASGGLTPTDTFHPYLGDLSDGSWVNKAATLEGYVLLDKIPHTDAAKTDAGGLAHFPSSGKVLTKGLYLVRGLRHTFDGRYYDPTAFLVLLPGTDAQTGEWVYDVAVSAKYQSQPIPDTPTTIKRKVLKVWDNRHHGSSQPQSVTVYLLRDGVVVDTVTLNDANNWRKTWDFLDSRYHWMVVEEPVTNYDTVVFQQGITFVVKNTRREDIPDETAPKPPPDSPTKPTECVPKPTTSGQNSGKNQPLPQTGQLWWPVPLLLFAGLGFVIFGLIRRRKESDEEEK